MHCVSALEHGRRLQERHVFLCPQYIHSILIKSVHLCYVKIRDPNKMGLNITKIIIAFFSFILYVGYISYF